MVNCEKTELERLIMFTIGAFAIILDIQQRVLLCHRKDMDRWNLPGGGVMDGETPWQAVIREVREEVGLQVSINPLASYIAYQRSARVLRASSDENTPAPFG